MGLSGPSSSSAAPVHKDVGGAYFHGKQPDIEKPSGRAISAPIPSGWAGLGAKHGLWFDKGQRRGPMVLQVVGIVPAAERRRDVGRGVHRLPPGVRAHAVHRRPGLFYLHDETGLLLMAGTFVDDYKLVV